MLLSFLVPAAILGLGYASLRVFPFGPRSVLVLDLNGQYVDFYSALRRIVFDGRSPFYSWDMLLGGNMFSIVSYYLTSPFSLIPLLFPQAYLTEALAVMTLAKVGSAGLAMAYYLRQSQRASGIELVIFSTPYALMGYVLVFSHNIMWLDGVILLPVIALGIEKLVREGRFGLYWAALALMLAANYYIGFMLCIFSALYFAAQSVLCFERGQARVLLRRLGLFAAASLLSAGSAAFLLLPTYFGLSTGKMIFSRASFDLVPKFNPLDLLPKLLPGSYDMTFSNLPTLYCGILMVLLAGLFFFSPSAARRQKVVSAGLLAVLLVSLFLSGLDLLWHGFALPTGFHYRYVFLLVFLVIQMAHQAYRGLARISLQALAGGFAVGLGLLAVIKLRGTSYLPDGLLLAALILLCVYAALLWMLRRNPASAQVFTLLLAGVVLLEAGLNTLVDLRKTHQEFGYIDRAAYTSYNALLAPVVAEIQRADAGFYRIEKTFYRSYNDALGLGYRGVTHYSSSFNRPVLTF